MTVSAEILPKSATARFRARFRLARGFPYVSATVLSAVIVAAVAGDLIAPWDPNGLDLGAAFNPPFWQEGGSLEHLLGTDNLGRDILSRIIAGAQVSLVVAFYAIIFSGGLGGLIGMIAGYFGGVVDAVIMRLVDIQMSIPSLALALMLAAVLSPSLSTVVIVIVRQLLDLVCPHHPQRNPVAEGARLCRARQGRRLQHAVIFARHLLPNILNTLFVLATLQVGQVIIFEACLSFLGLGIQMPDVSWGLMLADARSYITNAWWAITMPGIAIMLTCLSST